MEEEGQVLNHYINHDQVVASPVNDIKVATIASRRSELHLFWHQVTGHNILLNYDRHTLCKPLKEREIRFYLTIPQLFPQLEPFVPKYRGAIDVAWVEDENYVAHLIGTPVENDVLSNGAFQARKNSVSSPSTPCGDKSFRIKILHSGDHVEIQTPKNVNADSNNNNKCEPRQARELAIKARSTSVHPWSLEHCAKELNKLRLEANNGPVRFILLENLTDRFSQPCVLDLKMGTRLHGDDEPDAKKERKVRRSLESTSHELGVRLGGMEVYDVSTGSYRTRDKFYGRLLNASQFRASIWEFLHSGERFRYELVEPFKRRLNAIIETLQRFIGFRFFSSSLLLIYDGFPPQNEVELLESLANDSLVDVRMVDFAYTTWPDCDVADQCYFGPDSGYLLGLKTIVGYLDELLAAKQDNLDQEDGMSCSSSSNQ